MKILLNNDDLNEALKNVSKLGFVPTMGGLHQGHISLIKRSKKQCKKTIVSIFVNPTQFNNKRDYIKYPRNIKKDLSILKKLKVSFVFIPKKENIYNFSRKIKIAKKDKILCAKYRKGHFEGVLAVVNRFLNGIKSKYIFLGEKDFQQLYLIKKYLGNKFTTKIISCKTIRNKNKLPLSSRNTLLHKKSLKKSEQISLILFNYKKKILNNFKNIDNLNIYKSNIKNLCDKIEYFEIRNRNNLSKKFNKKNFKIFISYRQKNVRLIDNF